ncbi:MAG: hypothetical protein IJK33_05870 [Clostridia bacterium]|nr:hypothetical protein [Clostridia bacterium]
MSYDVMRTSCMMCACGTIAEHITSLCGKAAKHHYAVRHYITCVDRRKHH